MEQPQNNNQLLATKSEELRNLRRNLKGVEVSSKTSLMEIRKLNFPPLTHLIPRDAENNPIRNQFGKVDKSLCYDFIAEYISNVLVFFGEDWKSDLIYDTAEAIYADYYYLTFADWKLLAQRIKSSYYGKVYGKFTPAVLMDWIGHYANEWTQCSIDISLSGNDAHKKLSDSRDEREQLEQAIKIGTMYHKLQIR